MVSAARLRTLRGQLEANAAVRAARPDVSQLGRLVHGDDHTRVYWNGDSSALVLRCGGVTHLSGTCALCLIGPCPVHPDPVAGPVR
jgi:hypothetical protein